jgi:peroxiredoxin
MEITLLVARLLLAIVFAAAGTAKVADLAGTRRAAIDFGVPEKLAIPLGYGLPFLEIVIAMTLLPRSTAWIAADAGLGLLLVFAAAIAINLSRGRAPDCNCFGRLHSRPVSWSLVGRDLALSSVAGLIVVEGRGNPGLSAFDWAATLRAGEAASLAFGVAALGLMGTSLVYLRGIARRQLSLLADVQAMKKVIDEDYAEAPVERAEAVGPLHGLPVGAAAPQFSLASISGEQVTLDDLLACRKPVVLIFVSPNCAPCESVLQSVETWERDYRKALTIATLATGVPNEISDRMARFRAKHLLLQAEFGLAEEYEAKWTPAAVLIGPNGRIASHVSYGYEQIDALVTRSSRDLDAPALAKGQTNGNGHEPQIIVGTPQSLMNIGRPVPDFSLQDVDGNVVSPKDLLGRDTLLLFWDPKCPFCRAMEGDIRMWEQNPPRRAPRLVFISSGDLEDVKADSARFKARFLCDSEFTVGQRFGTNLTPSAVLIDSDGRIASGTQGGRPNILTLAGVRKSAMLAASCP